MPPTTRQADDLLKVPVFVSFDYDNDRSLKELFLGQAKLRNSPFSFADWSVKEESKDWRDQARYRIKRAERVIVICGHQTHLATGVGEEVRIARDEQTPYFLLRGYKHGRARKPPGTLFAPVHQWSWSNIEQQLGRQRHWYFG